MGARGYCGGPLPSGTVTPRNAVSPTCTRTDAFPASIRCAIETAFAIGERPAGVARLQVGVRLDQPPSCSRRA